MGNGNNIPLHLLNRPTMFSHDLAEDRASQIRLSRRGGQASQQEGRQDVGRDISGTGEPGEAGR